VPPELHNRPEKIRAAVEEAAKATTSSSAYAHCGADLAGYAKLPGAHCYEVYGAEHEPATYFLTDFLVRSFDNVVWRGLGLAAIPSCATTTSATTNASSGSHKNHRTSSGRRRSALLKDSACRSKCERLAIPGSNKPWSDYWRTPVLTNDLPRYEILDEAALGELERGWRRIVSELGIEFLYEEALEYFRKAGQDVEASS